MKNLHLKIAIILLLISNVFLFIQNPTAPKPEPNPDNELKYFRDQIILATDDTLITIGLNRKELEPGKYIHYYSALLFKDGKTYTEYQDDYSPAAEVQKNRFLTSFDNQQFDDLSTRENYKFSVNIQGTAIEAEINDLEGDFITKNDINYTRYLSNGLAKVKIDGKELTMDANLEKSYAADYSEYIFFDNYQDLSSRTYKFDLWDQDHNYYLVDQSEVNEPNPHYRPHTWVLYKKGLENKKAFAADIRFSENGRDKNWQISVPRLELEMDLHTSYARNTTWYSGPITGTINGKEVFGYFSYKAS